MIYLMFFAYVSLVCVTDNQDLHLAVDILARSCSGLSPIGMSQAGTLCSSQTSSEVEAYSSVYESEHRDRAHSSRGIELGNKARNFFDRYRGFLILCQCLGIMVKEEEIITEAGGRGYMDMVSLGDEDFFQCLSPSSYFSSSVISTATTCATPAASSPTCVSYMDMAPYDHLLNFTGRQEQYDCYSNGPFCLQYNGADRATPVVFPQKSSPTTECSSSISMSSSPPATSISAISSTKPQALKKKGARCSDQRKGATASATNKKPRVRRERLGERIIALQQLVSPFGKSDTATVLHEALGYIRFLHDQVQVLSSPYMQSLPAAAHATVHESAAGTVVEPPQRPSDLRSRGLCLVPISFTDRVAGDGRCNGADLWSVAVPAVTKNVTAAAGSKGAAAALPGGHPGHLA